MGVALIALARVFATHGIPRWIPPALLVRVGVASPLTGMTRSFVAVASGHIGRAFELHPLGPLAFAACIASAAIAAVSFYRGYRIDIAARIATNHVLWYSVAALFACAWVRQIVVFG
jgi:hypothetical protein